MVMRFACSPSARSSTSRKRPAASACEVTGGLRRRNTSNNELVGLSMMSVGAMCKDMCSRYQKKFGGVDSARVALFGSGSALATAHPLRWHRTVLRHLVWTFRSHVATSAQLQTVRRPFINLTSTIIITRSHSVSPFRGKPSREGGLIGSDRWDCWTEAVPDHSRASLISSWRCLEGFALRRR